jgi:hypothetical protein
VAVAVAVAVARSTVADAPVPPGGRSVRGRRGGVDEAGEPLQGFGAPAARVRVEHHEHEPAGAGDIEFLAVQFERPDPWAVEEADPAASRLRLP